MPTYHIQTFGCQMNYSDSERMETYLQALGYKLAKSFKKADLILFNTCSIRQKAEDRVLGLMGTLEELRKKNPDLIVVISGCMVRKSSSRYSEERDKLFNRTQEIDVALRTEELPRLASLIREINPDFKIEEIKEESLEDYFRIDPSLTSHASGTQAFLPISNGCDKFCTYCIVPYSRGREKSRKIEDILKDAEELVKKGIKEITLIGQTVNSYGLSQYDKTEGFFQKQDKKEPFVQLLEQLDKLKAKGLCRVRWTSSHPKDMSDQLIEAMSRLETQMPYLHLPVQSGDDRTLKRMNRPYTTEQYRQIIKKLRKHIPDISISTDVIVGFCDESDEEFENTLKFFKEMKFEHAYHAMYSNRKGTTADRFMKDNIPTKVKKERWDRLNDLLREQSKAAHARFKNKIVHVLVEKRKGKNNIGRSEHFKEVHFKSGRNLLGQIIPVRITEPKEWILIGEMA